ncbi:MAG: 4Fe-4S cluster-binding domain-containing protein, partial [Selenomonadaceae bacterium]|nr:4Fe-4S cluster-binding domain-containing protein [Selenomonadaceae bacterium]
MGELYGMIFNIQKFSINDGPGIRTVVFFKGCPLSCGWCANPESQDTRFQVMWDDKKCRQCQTCVKS